MNAIIKIVTTSETFKRDIDITVRPSRDAAENLLEAVQEFLTDFKKENATTIVNRIIIESETTGKVIADLNFKKTKP